MDMGGRDVNAETDDTSGAALTNERKQSLQHDDLPTVLMSARAHVRPLLPSLVFLTGSSRRIA